MKLRDSAAIARGGQCQLKVKPGRSALCALLGIDLQLRYSAVQTSTGCGGNSSCDPLVTSLYACVLLKEKSIIPAHRTSMAHVHYYPAKTNAVSRKINKLIVPSSNGKTNKGKPSIGQ